ncbi:GNAT family N-acetyltransferase [Nocardioides sp. cx-173]|uniref:GNAT family N-acetyltransferase n=1 Tax=Nocardioides sp. cx-173 TaxID=2898796 RepID=UPI001E616C2B|nr:GNAT family N-acetyltransferase [Nocardioides sp. cx-173]MCD4524706.1 GNAT family N-acetyltransferase [Nocardioides sp. cx-173]UGB43216.1 GNAT family N-acetyltransferase [Nocardioides sp. cx-173]
MVTRLVMCHTAEMTPEELHAVRALLDGAFREFTDQDWGHTLGGQHALVVEDGVVVAHGALVMRRLLHAGRSLRTGYLESVATRPDRTRRGHADRVMTALESLAPAYDVLALSASEAGVPLYESRGWQLWRGPSSVLAPDGITRTPADDSSIYVLGGSDLDLDGELTCDWRDGDLW